MTNKTIFVVDDDVEVCDGLRWLFESVNFNVETYTSAKKFLAHYDPTREACLVLDVRMPVISGLELLDRLGLVKNRLPIIIITGHGDIAMAVSAMKAGAVDFILKPIDDQYLLEIINYHFDKLSQKKEIEPVPLQHLLTKREQEIMDLIADGKLNKQIAYELNISISTVEAHRSRIMHKFGAKNLAQLIKKYYGPNKVNKTKGLIAP